MSRFASPRRVPWLPLAATAFDRLAVEAGRLPRSGCVHGRDTSKSFWSGPARRCGFRYRCRLGVSSGAVRDVRALPGRDAVVRLGWR